MRRARFHDCARLACAMAALQAIGCKGGDGGEPARKPPRESAAVPDASTVSDAGAPDAQISSPGGQRAPAPLDAGRPLGMNPDALFGVSQPHGRRSSARIAAWVVDLEDAPIPAAFATTGGTISVGSASGHVAIEDVYGESEADLFITAAGFTRGHVRVPIRPDATSYAVVVLAKLTSVAVGALEGEGEIARDAGFGLAFDAKSFAQPWGATASGEGTLSYAALVQTNEAAAGPASLVAVADDGTRLRLAVRGLFELGASARGAQLNLRRPVRIELQLAPLVAADRDTPTAALGLYWFDPEQAAFVRRAEFEERADDGVGRGAIDRLGFWAVGSSDASTRRACQRVRVEDATGAPVANAAVRLTSFTRPESAHLYTGADGSVCWEARPGSVLRAQVFGERDGLLLSADSDGLSVPADAEPGACTDEPGTCATSQPVIAAPIAQGCVRGTLDRATFHPSAWQVSPDAGAGRSNGTIAASQGDAFCVTVPRSGELTLMGQGGVVGFTGVMIECGETHKVQSPGICGVSACDDLGLVRCCGADEVCDNDTDDDCDDSVDEGCRCGTQACSALALSVSRCCTDEAVCGNRSPHTGTCVLRDTSGRIDTSCPSESVPVQGGSTATAPGCCLPDGDCGLYDADLGCVLRADAATVWPITASLAPFECTGP